MNPLLHTYSLPYYHIISKNAPVSCFAGRLGNVTASVCALVSEQRSRSIFLIVYCSESNCKWPPAKFATNYLPSALTWHLSDAAAASSYIQTVRGTELLVHLVHSLDTLIPVVSRFLVPLEICINVMLTNSVSMLHFLQTCCQQYPVSCSL
jgi:hypothetical protein